MKASELPEFFSFAKRMSLMNHPADEVIAKFEDFNRLPAEVVINM